jgi:hypothetical protein
MDRAVTAAISVESVTLNLLFLVKISRFASLVWFRRFARRVIFFLLIAYKRLGRANRENGAFFATYGDCDRAKCHDFSIIV